MVIDDKFLSEFELRVDRAGSCHHWIGACSNGLPMFRGRTATKIAWELAHGYPVPPGRHVRRRCSAPLCVRAEHLTVDADEHVKRPGKKLSRYLADDVRARHVGGETVAELAVGFGITRQHVHAIVTGKAWAGDGMRKPKPGSVDIVRVEVDADGIKVDQLACGHAVPSVNWPNKWRRCPSCAEALEAAP